MLVPETQGVLCSLRQIHRPGAEAAGPGEPLAAGAFPLPAFLKAPPLRRSWRNSPCSHPFRQGIINADRTVNMEKRRADDGG